MTIRTYSELITFPTFKERYEYLRLKAAVGGETFGFERYLNQVFYKSKEWASVRDYVIIRDNGCDLGVEGYDIYGKIVVHHLNPITKHDLESTSDYILNPEYLICTTHSTHNAIHYGDERLLPQMPIVRSQNDTCPWKH